ncbi:MAG: hypothetical protein ACO236_06820 [Candidatus Nanopelagicaceae bacterium]
MATAYDLQLTKNNLFIRDKLAEIRHNNTELDLIGQMRELVNAYKIHLAEQKNVSISNKRKPDDEVSGPVTRSQSKRQRTEDQMDIDM